MTRPDMADRVKLHFVQDVPTPHNNVLLKALDRVEGVDLVVWYAQLSLPQYSFGPELGRAVKEPIVYGARRPSWRLLGTALRSWRDKWLVVGWINPTTRILVPLFWLLRRPYNVWFDLPRGGGSAPRRFVRNLYYAMVRSSRARVFAVGKEAVRYFRERGFAENRVFNLPIFVSVDGSPDEYRSRREAIRRTYHVGEDDLFVVTGSRLIPEKGFDLLIRAIDSCSSHVRSRTKLLLIGRGPEETALRDQARRCGLAESIYFSDWMEHDDFMQHLGAADVVVHPARLDAYGGITLSAMVAGMPLIASRGAGAAVDRVEHAQNGWLYDAEDTAALAHLLETAFSDRATLARLGQNARATAEAFAPDRGARRLASQLL